MKRRYYTIFDVLTIKDTTLFNLGCTHCGHLARNHYSPNSSSVLDKRGACHDCWTSKKHCPSFFNTEPSPYSILNRFRI